MDKIDSINFHKDKPSIDTYVEEQVDPATYVCEREREREHLQTHTLQMSTDTASYHVC